MNSSSVRPRTRGFVLFQLGSLAILGSALGCSGGQNVTPEAIDQAKRLWKATGIRDYELELNWTTNGQTHSITSSL